MLEMERSIRERVSVIAALVLVIAVNAAANVVPIAGLQTGEVSAMYASYFTPAGITFAIWSVIYSGLILYAIYQVFPQRRGEARLATIGRLFSLNCVLNSVWLFAWHYQYLGISLGLMLCILATLVMIYRHLGSGADVSLLVRVPFTLYLAWICVATLANLSALQTALDWNDALLSHEAWTLIKLAFAAAVGAAVCLLRRDPLFVLVIAWAAYGISVKQAEVPEVYGAAVAVSAIGVMLAAFTLASRPMFRPR
ncbi:MAG: TspO/MBR family protein [Pseudomonadota bacterium]